MEVSKKVVIAGGSGFIGQYFTAQFTKLGYRVYLVSRQKGNNNIEWQNIEGIVDALNGAGMLINLAGKSVNCRYNPKNKEEILKSRTETTRTLGKAISKCTHPPELWINSSTATIYRHSEDRPMTEEGGELGSGFSVSVAKSWEEAFFSFKFPNTRQVALRIAIVLGKDGGVVQPYINLVRFGLGGTQGKGNQKFSFIYVHDLFKVLLFVNENRHLQGVINCSAPNPTDNKTLMKTLRQTMGIPFGLPTPKFLLEIGAVLIKTETELILKSRWAIPKRLLDAGFVFQYPTIELTLREILDK